MKCKGYICSESTANFSDKKWIITGLLLKAAPPCCDALGCPCTHVKHGSPHHCRVKLSHFPSDVSLQLVEGGRARAVHLGLQVAPEAEVEGGEAGGSRRLPKLVNDKDITALD